MPRSEVNALTTTSFPVVTFNVTGNIDPRRLRDLPAWFRGRRFSRVRGVGRVKCWGDVREVEVILDPARTAALEAHAREDRQQDPRVDGLAVCRSLRRRPRARDRGRLRRGCECLRRRGALRRGRRGRQPIPLSAIANVTEGAADRLLRVSGPGGETALVSVSRLPGASTPDVVGRVRQAVQQATASFPAGVTVTPVYDQRHSSTSRCVPCGTRSSSVSGCASP